MALLGEVGSQAPACSEGVGGGGGGLRRGCEVTVWKDGWLKGEIRMHMAMNDMIIDHLNKGPIVYHLFLKLFSNCPLASCLCSLQHSPWPICFASLDTL